MGGFGFFRKVSSLFSLCSFFIDFWFMFSVICCLVLNRLFSIGIDDFLGFLNRIVGLFVFSVWL